MYILIEYPLQSLLKRSDFIERIAKWGTRLKSFDIRYRPRNSVKGQVLTNFIIEFTPVEKSPSRVYNIVIQPWRVFTNGTSNALYYVTRGGEVGALFKIGFPSIK